MSTITSEPARLVDYQVVHPQRPPCHESQINVAETERWLSVAAGAALGIVGASRRSLGGLGRMMIGGGLVYRGVTGHCAAYQALGVDRSGYDSPSVGVRAQHGLRYEKSILILDTPANLYAFWRRLENLPQVMRHLTSVTQEDQVRSHWVARGPLGAEVVWDAEIINERPNEMIAWRSVPGSQMDTAGSVHFQALPGNRGTMLRVELKYDPPGGWAAATVTRFLGAGLEASIDEDLDRFKQMREAGEIASVSGQPQGKCRG